MRLDARISPQVRHRRKDLFGGQASRLVTVGIRRIVLHPGNGAAGGDHQDER